ncbi:MAG TPA: hypothetical protein VFG68_05255, partial [Fimbriiglobus sp.]|nr:hypothetical protein [Fimbriiglobus sp.]
QEEALEGVATGSGSPVAEACGMLIEDGPEKRTFLSGPNCGHIYWGLTKYDPSRCTRPRFDVT